MRKNVLKKIAFIAMTVVMMVPLMFIKDAGASAMEVKGAGINVEKIDGISDDFIMGMDVSSYVSITKSGVVFKDFDGNALDDAGFFNLLKSSGVNYIRIRVWNDPYDANGNGYGGGNCDLENAAVIGKLATNAGMKVLVDFHYSDFWADPSRQLVPKEWKGYSVSEKETAIYNYTKQSLTYLKNQGVNIGMVQVGNETTGGICGESNETNMYKLFKAGCKAVREIDNNILIALHYTDPHKRDYKAIATKLNNNGVDYDVFASSYYPSWHGTISNLVAKLKAVSDSCGKKVMVVETAYPHTTTDYDKSGNDTLNYQLSGFPEVSVQGQADYMAQLIKAVADIGDNAIGVCYWEGAWTAVGTNKETNKSIWETYGSGWATSYANEYDSAHVGEWYGGPTTDNQCFFDGESKALASLNIFNYVKTGATTENNQESSTEDTQESDVTQDTEVTKNTETTKETETAKETETTKEKETTKETETTRKTETTKETSANDNETTVLVNVEDKTTTGLKEEKTSPVLNVIMVTEVIAIIVAVVVLTIIIIKKKKK